MLKRFSISLEESLLDKFDCSIQAYQYDNCSEAKRDLIRQAMVKKEWQADKQLIGGISLVHMDHDNNCMEVIIVWGRAAAVQELANRLIALGEYFFTHQ